MFGATLICNTLIALRQTIAIFSELKTIILTAERLEKETERQPHVGNVPQRAGHHPHFSCY